MKITLIHYSVHPVVGGVEAVIRHHSRLLAQDMHQVKIIAGRGQQIDSRIPVINLPTVDSLHPKVLAIKSDLDRGKVPQNFKEFANEIESSLTDLVSNDDVLIAHNVCSLNKNLALTAALHNLSQRCERPRLILWHHDLAWRMSRYRAELHDGYPWSLLSEAWGGVKQVTVSEIRQQELAELFQISKDEIAVVPSGVDVGKFHKLEKLTRAYVRQLNLFGASPLLLLPVRITPRKNIELALHMLTNLKKDFPDATLVVTGPLGPHSTSNVEYFKKLTALRQELGLIQSVHFLTELVDGYMPDEVIYDFYHLADALFLPSREEGFGIPILEAGLAGLPIFCADIPPLRSLGGNHATYFSPDADPQELAKLVANHLSPNPMFCLRSNVRKQYTWERVYAEKIVPLLHDEHPRDT